MLSGDEIVSSVGVLIWITSKKERKMGEIVARHLADTYLMFSGMGKEVENLIMENNELLATK
jgi:hypothetical protein